MNTLLMAGLLIYVALQITACTSGAAINYYALSPASASAVETATSARKTVVIEGVQLAGFLKQSGLVIQRGQNQLHLSKTHLWAEPLDDALPKALQIKLQQLSTDYVYYLKSIDWINRTDTRLKLRIDSLHANEQGEVVAAGRYQLIATAHPQQPLVKDFYFKRDLEQDGYTHAVAQIDILVSQIAADILSSIKTLPAAP